eukprot:COSAG05_NODE_3497_length_2026_cov_1.785677_1_plen_277_part_00
MTLPRGREGRLSCGGGATGGAVHVDVPHWVEDGPPAAGTEPEGDSSESSFEHGSLLFVGTQEVSPAQREHRRRGKRGGTGGSKAKASWRVALQCGAGERALCGAPMTPRTAPPEPQRIVIDSGGLISSPSGHRAEDGSGTPREAAGNSEHSLLLQGGQGTDEGVQVLLAAPVDADREEDERERLQHRQRHVALGPPQGSNLPGVDEPSTPALADNGGGAAFTALHATLSIVERELSFFGELEPPPPTWRQRRATLLNCCGCCCKRGAYASASNRQC